MPHHTTVLLTFVAAAFVMIPANAAAQAAPPAGASHDGHGPAILVNASELSWGDAPGSLPPGAKAVVLEGNPAKSGPFTLRLLLPDDYQIMPHSHPGIEHVTVLSGSFYIGTGTTQDFSRMTALKAGGFMAMPPNMVHYARARGETVIQLHGLGPWMINYVDPAHDPRRR